MQQEKSKTRLTAQTSKVRQKSLSPGGAIHSFCFGCVGGAREVQKCGGGHCRFGCDSKGVCSFYSFRFGKGRPSVKLIRRYCLSCKSGSTELVRECSESSCPLLPFRMGTNPNRVEEGKKTLPKDDVRGVLNGQNRRSLAGTKEGAPCKDVKKRRAVSSSKKSRAASSRKVGRHKRQPAVAQEGRI